MNDQMKPREALWWESRCSGCYNGLRLRYQLMQHRASDGPSDLITLSRMSSIDRSVIARAVREVSLAQRRMANVSQFVPAEAWARPEPAH